MPTFYGPPSDGTIIPAELEDALAVDLTLPDTVLGAATREVATMTGAARALAGRLSARSLSVIPTTDVPTVATWSTTRTSTDSWYPHAFVTHTETAIGDPNGIMGRLDNGMQPMEFVFTGNELDLSITVTNGYGPTVQVWVDGHPLPAPIVTPELTTNVNGWLRLQWSQARTRHLRIVNYGASPRSLWTPDGSAQVYPTTGKPRIGLLADSFGGQTSYVSNYEAFPAIIERELNVNIVRSVMGGSGYIAGGQVGRPYAHAQRRAELLRGAPLDALLFWGSINDGNSTGEAAVRDVVRQAWDDYASDHPGAPIVVAGVEPSGGANATNADNHARNAWMRDEASKHPAVVGFIDMLGTSATGEVPPVWSATPAYSRGDLVTHLGAQYRCLVDTVQGNYIPSRSNVHWGRVSWAFSGTGNTGNLKGDGNRDFLLGGDGVHPTASGSEAFGQLLSQSLVRALASRDPFTVVGL